MSRHDDIEHNTGHCWHCRRKPMDCVCIDDHHPDWDTMYELHRDGHFA